MAMTTISSQSFQHCIPAGFEFIAGFPFGILVGVGDFVTQFKEDAEVFDGTGELPIGLHLVAGLVVVVGVEILAHLLAETGWLADECGPRFGVEGGYAFLRELEMIGAVVEAFLRFGVAGHSASVGFED